MPLTPDEEQLILDLVRAAARDHILPRFRQLDGAQVEAKSRADDLVTIADREAEAAMTAALLQAMPGVTVVGEEACELDPTLPEQIPQASRAVILDPVDGTWNFAAGLASFGVILAVAEAAETVFGLLYDPICDDWVLARKGGGAWFCRPGAAPRRLKLGAGAPEAMGLIASVSHFPPAHQAGLEAALSERQAAGRSGTLRCSCHEYRLLAFAKARALIAADPKPWDHAAGVLVAQEAGGAAAYLDGRPYRPGPGQGVLAVGASPAGLEEIRAEFHWLTKTEAAQ